MAYLESDMLIPDADFKLLLPDNILLRPIRVIFPVRCSAGVHCHHTSNVLRDLARLDDSLELLHHERSDPHYEVRINSCVWSVWGDDTHSLSG